MPTEQVQAHPTIYEIQVAGQIDPERSSWFGDVSLCVKHIEGTVITALSVPVKDQAALFGILSLVRDLGLKLISVNRIKPDAETEAQEPSYD